MFENAEANIKKNLSLKLLGNEEREKFSSWAEIFCVKGQLTAQKNWNGVKGNSDDAEKYQILSVGALPAFGCIWSKLGRYHRKRPRFVYRSVFDTRCLVRSSWQFGARKILGFYSPTTSGVHGTSLMIRLPSKIYYDYFQLKVDTKSYHA